MTQDRPTAGELVTAVREFLEHDVMAATEGRVQFHTRVAVNVLDIVERELDRRARRSPRPSAAGPRALLGHDGDARALERELAAAIRDGIARRPARRGARARARDRAGEAPRREPGLPPRDSAGLACAPHADRHLERQLAEGPAAARRGVPRLRRRRRAVPPGDEALRQDLPRADVLRPRLRVGAQRPGPVERCRDPLAGRHRRTSRTASTTRTSTPTKATRASLAADCGGIRVVSVYVPNGREVAHRLLRPQARAGCRRCTTGSRPRTPPTTRSWCSATSTSRPKTATCGTRRSSSARPT